MRIIRLLSCFILALALWPLQAAAQSGPEGRWMTIDDDTGQPKSIVQISRTDEGNLQGTVVEILQSDSGPDPVCDRCSGDRKDQPIEGMTILWGMSAKDDNEWAGGTILDPSNGRSYRAKMQMHEDGRLGVSGCVTFICREQLWQRE